MRAQWKLNSDTFSGIPIQSDLSCGNHDLHVYQLTNATLMRNLLPKNWLITKATPKYEHSFAAVLKPANSEIWSKARRQAMHEIAAAAAVSHWLQQLLLEPAAQAAASGGPAPLSICIATLSLANAHFSPWASQCADSPGVRRAVERSGVAIAGARLQPVRQATLIALWLCVLLSVVVLSRASLGQGFTTYMYVHVCEPAAVDKGAPAETTALREEVYKVHHFKTQPQHHVVD